MDKDNREEGTRDEYIDEAAFLEALGMVDKEKVSIRWNEDGTIFTADHACIFCNSIQLRPIWNESEFLLIEVSLHDPVLKQDISFKMSMGSFMSLAPRMFYLGAVIDHALELTESPFIRALMGLFSGMQEAIEEDELHTKEPEGDPIPTSDRREA